MAEMGAHSALSGAIAIMVFRILASVSLLGQAIIVAIVSFLGHLFLDIFPHGHTKKMWKELISGAIIIPIVLYLSFSHGKRGLLLLSCVSLFFGNIFDVALEAAGILRKKYAGQLRWAAEKVIEFNLWIHWFVRSQTFCLGARQNESRENWKGRPVYSWKYGWYNLIPLLLGIVAFLVVL
jgi:hypothetical protein